MRFEYEGDPQVLRNVVLRKRYLDQGDPRADLISPTLYVGPGVLRGVMSAGHGRTLERRGLISAFKHIVGCSTGLAAGHFAPGGQIAEQIHIYWEEAASREFINIRRLGSGKPVENTDFLCNVFRERLDVAAFRTSPIGMWACVTSAVTGDGVLLDVKDDRHHPSDYVQASISLPGLSSGPVFIHGHPYYDGAGAMSMPTREIIERLKPTDLLIFANCSKRDKDTLVSRLLTKTMMAGVPPLIRNIFVTRDERHVEGVEYIRSQKDVRWAIVWGEGIGSFESNPDKLKAAAREADEFIEAFLCKHALVAT